MNMLLQKMLPSGLEACAGQACLPVVKQIEKILQEFKEQHAKPTEDLEAFDVRSMAAMTTLTSDALAAMRSLAPNDKFSSYIEGVGKCAQDKITLELCPSVNPELPDKTQLPAAIYTQFPCGILGCQNVCSQTATTLAYICGVYGAVCPPCAALCLLTDAQQYQKCLANCVHNYTPCGPSGTL